MEGPANAVPTIFPDDGIVFSLCVLLNSEAYVPEAGPGAYQCNANAQAFVGRGHQALGLDRGAPDLEHHAGVAMEAIFDDGDVDVNHVTLF